MRNDRVASPSVSVSLVGDRPAGSIRKNTGGEVMIHISTVLCGRAKGTAIRGLHGVYFYPPLPRVQSRYNNAVNSATGELASCARRLQNVHSCRWSSDTNGEAERVHDCASWLPPFAQFPGYSPPPPHPPTPDSSGPLC